MERNAVVLSQILNGPILLLQNSLHPQKEIQIIIKVHIITILEGKYQAYPSNWLKLDKRTVTGRTVTGLLRSLKPVVLLHWQNSHWPSIWAKIALPTEFNHLVLSNFKSKASCIFISECSDCRIMRELDYYFRPLMVYKQLPPNDARMYWLYVIKCSK